MYLFLQNARFEILQACQHLLKMSFLNMKQVILFLWSLILCVGSTFAAESCFLVKENNQVLISEGDCTTRYSPASTFKIALSLIGFDSGILHDENNPSWPYKEEYSCYFNFCKSDHVPRTWMRDSCLWYSQILTRELGMEKFKAYIDNFNYGNRDLSGDKGQNNGLTRAWVSSSLEISPDEQTEFLQKIVEQTLPVSKTSYDLTKKIMFIEELPGGWKLYGRTGNGTLLDQNHNKTDLQHGWFVGYMEKGERRIVFTSHIVDREKQDIFPMFRARNETLVKLWYLIHELEK
jgi:beta-lactamase class D